MHLTPWSPRSDVTYRTLVLTCDTQQSSRNQNAERFCQPHSPCTPVPLTSGPFLEFSISESYTTHTGVAGLCLAVLQPTLLSTLWALHLLSLPELSHARLPRAPGTGWEMWRTQMPSKDGRRSSSRALGPSVCTSPLNPGEIPGRATQKIKGCKGEILTEK